MLFRVLFFAGSYFLVLGFGFVGGLVGVLEVKLKVGSVLFYFISREWKNRFIEGLRVRLGFKLNFLNFFFDSR